MAANDVTPQGPAVAPGWYPDPEQAQTQRYWDGAMWTEQRAPLAKESNRAEADVTQRLILGCLGAAIAIVGCFLPHAESGSLLHIANNTLLQTGDGIFVIFISVAGAAAAIRDRSTPKVAWALLILGVVVVVFAFYSGSSSQLQLESGLGQRLQGSVGPGVWAVGIGGALMALGGLLSPTATTEES